MKKTSNIVNTLPKHLFWDMDANKLSSKKDIYDLYFIADKVSLENLYESLKTKQENFKM